MSHIDQTGIKLRPCPFCGGKVQLELANITRDWLYGDENGNRNWYGVTCRNTINHGGTCCMAQVPSASKEAAIKRWNMRNGVAWDGKEEEPIVPTPFPTGIHLPDDYIRFLKDDKSREMIQKWLNGDWTL